MEEKELLEEIKKVSGQVEAFKKSIGDKADKAAFDEAIKKLEELKASLKDLTAEKFESAIKTVNESLGKVAKQIEEMSEDVAKAKESGKGRVQAKTFGQQVVEALVANKLLEGKFGKNEHRTLEIKDVSILNKTVANMGTGNVDAVGSSSIPWELSSFEPGLTNIQKRRPWLIDIANTSPISTMYAQWAEKSGQEGAANETAEGAAKNQIDFDWIEKSAKVEKVTAYIKASKESLSDLPGLANEIDNELREEVLLKADSDLLSGDGSTPSLNGILNQDTAYASGAFAATIVQANHWDVLRCAVAQVVTNKFIPNYVLMHPTDVAKLDLNKGSDGHYSMPPFKSADGMTISGVKIIENTGQTVDKFTVGDFSKMNVRVREGFTIDMGHDADDFTKNLITILGEIRLVCYIKANHAGAFVSGDFSDAIAELNLAI